ncbi:MAG: SDR family oxidoreductase [Sphingomonas sp.]
MPDIPYRSALIVGAGPGIGASAACARSPPPASRSRSPRAIRRGWPRSREETGAVALAADATDRAAVERLFDQVEAAIGVPEIVVYNASGRLRGALADLDPEDVRRAVDVSAWGGFLVVQQAAKRLLPLGRGAILLTGATASVKGFARSAPFAIGKFALRGLAQSAARELGPQGNPCRAFRDRRGGAQRHAPRAGGPPDSMLDPDAIAQSYVDVLRQPRSAWSAEITLRPWTEPF